MLNLRKNKKGFTLIELIVVMSIIAILAAVAIPNFAGLTNKATISNEVAAAAELANAGNVYNTLAAGNGKTVITTAADLTSGTLGELYPTFTSDTTKVLARISYNSTNGYFYVSKKD